MFLILIVVTLENFLANTFYKEAPRKAKAETDESRRAGFVAFILSVFDPLSDGVHHDHDISVSFSPIGPWPLLLGAAVAVTVLTLWAYSRRLKGTDGRWRYVAVTLRLLALLLCLLAALRPSVFLNEKKKQDASLVVLVDTQHEHEHRRRGPRPDAVGRRHAGGQAGEGIRQDAGARSRPQVLPFRLQADRAQGGRAGGRGETHGPRDASSGSAMLEAQKRTESTSRRHGPAGDPLGFRHQ